LAHGEFERVNHGVAGQEDSLAGYAFGQGLVGLHQV